MTRSPLFGNGLTSINRLRDEMDRAFNRVFQDFPAPPRSMAYPPMNVWEDKEHLYMEAELPGIPMESLEIYVKDKELVLEGERKLTEPESASFHRRERGVGKFRRALRLPVDIQADKVEARLKDGVLTVTLPKAEKAKPRKIEVRCA
jgi:HSP20 family protein